MTVLSLFDGISCGMAAPERAGVAVDNYIAYEIDKFAIQTSAKIILKLSAAEMFSTAVFPISAALICFSAAVPAPIGALPKRTARLTAAARVFAYLCSTSVRLRRQAHGIFCMKTITAFTKISRTKFQEGSAFSR